MFYAHRSDKHNFIMCTNGRCGSTLLKRWYLKLHGLPMPIESDYSSVHQSLMYDDPRFFVDPDKFNGMPHYKFLTVRNPWERLVSFYKVFVAINQQNHEGLGRAASFQDLVDQLVKRGPSDAHAISQTGQLDGLKFDRIVYVEDFDPGMRAVCAESGVPWEEGVFSNRVFASPTTSDEKWGANKISKTPGGTFVEKNVWPQWRDFYTSKLLASVSKIYAKDIETFGYKLDGPSGSLEFPTRASTKAKPVDTANKKMGTRRSRYRKEA